MSTESLKDKSLNIETPNDEKIAVQSQTKKSDAPNRVDINVLKSKLLEEESKEFKRNLFILNSGKAFTGTDTFEHNNKKQVKMKKGIHFFAYFHLHPDVELWDHPHLQTIILRLKNGEHWIFESDLGAVNIEESTFINSNNSQPQSAKRIVIKSSTFFKKTEIKWSLRRREIVSRNTRDADIFS